MSRKNRNARRTGYARPIILETKAATAEPSVTMCDDTCGYEYKRLMNNLLETDASYQRKIDISRVDRIVAGFDARLVNTVKVSNRDGHFTDHGYLGRRGMELDQLYPRRRGCFPAGIWRQL